MATPTNRSETVNDPASSTPTAIEDPPDTSTNTHDRVVDYRDVDRDRVARRAYELYLERGAADGGDFDDWLAAERELGASGLDADRDDGD